MTLGYQDKYGRNLGENRNTLEVYLVTKNPREGSKKIKWQKDKQKPK